MLTLSVLLSIAAAITLVLISWFVRRMKDGKFIRRLPGGRLSIDVRVIPSIFGWKTGMGRTQFAIAFAAATLLLGVFLDVFIMDVTHGPWINLFWSMTDGLGAFIIDKVHPGSSMLVGPVSLWGVLIWPWIVALAAFLLVRFGTRSSRITWTHPAALFLILTALVWAPYKSIDRALGANDPSWLSYYLAGY